MLVRLRSAKCMGIDALGITVEVNISSGIGIHLVGLADAAVKESLLRTITALQSLGFRIPGKKIVINLAPADLHKRGSGYDLPIALGIIAASEQMEMPDLDKYVILGELGLDGTVRPVNGALPVAEFAWKQGAEGCILPLASAMETIGFAQCHIYGVRDLTEALRVVCHRDDAADLIVRRDSVGKTGLAERRLSAGSDSNASLASGDSDVPDFADIVGQAAAKRGVEIAIAGGHNVIFVGPPGSGKSSMAKAMCGLMPPMTDREALQMRKIYSVAGRDAPVSDGICRRPFRSPHVSATTPALVGGGSDNPSPGEISLAHNGILFLDEFCELPKRTIEALRAPLEDKRIVLSRLRCKVVFPADFTLVAATNPCPCGYYGEGDRCRCSVGERSAYLSKLSGPLMDRIDIQLWVHPVGAAELVKGEKAEASAVVARRIAAARIIQQERFRSEEIFCNSQMNSRQLHNFCPLTEDCRDFLSKTGERMGLSARAMTRIVKIARTIADLEYVTSHCCTGDDDTGSVVIMEDWPIRLSHLAEAVSYRFLDRQVVR